jgi:hypothetical protein
VIVGIGGWAERQELPLPWLHVATQVKNYGFVFAATGELTLQLSWDRVLTSLVDVGFFSIHNILPLQSKPLERFGLEPSPACSRCGAASEDVLHFFAHCPRVADAWDHLAFAAAKALGGPLPDLHLLLLLNVPIYPPPMSKLLCWPYWLMLSW